MGFLDNIEDKTPPPPRPTGPHVAPSEPYAATALRNELFAVETAAEGTRNQTLCTAAFSLRSLINAGSLDEATTVDQLTDAARAVGLDDIEIERTIRSAFSGADQKVGARTVPERRSSPVSIHLRAKSGGEGRSVATSSIWGDFPPVDGADWIFDHDNSTTAIWGSGNEILWARGEALMIAGVLGLGKTTLAGLLVRGLLGLESSVLGLPIAEADKPILYLGMDRPKQIRRSMLRQFGPEDRERIAGRLVVRPGPPVEDMAANPLLLTMMAQEVGAGVVFMDSLKDAVIGLTTDEVAASYNRSRQHLLARDVDLVELHHMVKRNSTGGLPSDIADVYGSGWLTAGVGSVITLSGYPGDPVIKFKLAKQPAGEVGPWKLEHDPDAGKMTVQYCNLVTVVSNCGVNGATARDVAKALYDTRQPSDAEIKRAARKLDRLTSSGSLLRVDGHRGGTGGSVPTCWFVSAKTDEKSFSSGF